MKVKTIIKSRAQWLSAPSIFAYYALKTNSEHICFISELTWAKGFCYAFVIIFKNLCERRKVHLEIVRLPTIQSKLILGVWQGENNQYVIKLSETGTA